MNYLVWIYDDAGEPCWVAGFKTFGEARGLAVSLTEIAGLDAWVEPA
jgi:hypothetical protein